MTYARFAGFYDAIMGDRTNDIDRILGYIDRYLPSAASLLELGCGTGAVLAGLAGKLDVAGLDLSPEMLAVAARAVPDARLVQADMTAFSLDARFDVVICIFDTLNHLPDFGSWQRMFDRVHEHLTDGGIFAFDVNTTGRLRRLWRGHAFAVDFGPHTVVMDVFPDGAGTAGGSGGSSPRADAAGGDELSIWTVRIFEHLDRDLYRSHSETIPELGVPLERIRSALEPRFDLLEETALDGDAVSDDTDRVFFAYRRKAARSLP
jgi:SAM-dependent methyltransferase